MILYNTLMGVVAGAAMIATAGLAREIGRREEISPGGWAAALAAMGVVLTFLSAAMTVTWPVTAKPQANIMFGEPTLFLGVLLLAAAALLSWRGDAFTGIQDDAGYDRLVRMLTPLAWLVSCLGLILLVCAITIVKFHAIGNAPPAEPISGRMPSGVENTFMAVLYLLAALGTLPAPWAVRNLQGGLARTAGWALAVGGVLVLAYSAMNYYTHIGEIVLT